MERRENRRNEEGKQAAPLHFINQIQRVFHVLIRLPWTADDQRHDRKPVILVQYPEALQNHTGPVFDGKRDALAGHNLLGHPHRTRFKANQWRESFLLGMSAQSWKMDRTLRQQNIGKFFY